MDKDCKRVLEVIVSSMALHNGATFVELVEECQEQYSCMSKDTILAAYRVLRDRGYVSDVGERHRFIVEQKARHRMHYKLEEIHAFILKSVIVPIIVSVIVSAITTCLLPRP